MLLYGGNYTAKKEIFVWPLAANQIHILEESSYMATFKKFNLPLPSVLCFISLYSIQVKEKRKES